MSKHTSKPKLRLKLKYVYIIPVIFISLVGTLLFIFNFTSPKKVSAATETISSGSFIVNMGVTPQTYSNGLRPYGMIYELMVKYSVPIKWVIEPTKAKDGTDFTYGGTNYKGGTFIIPAENITSAITARITYWTGQGVVGVYTTSSISVPVYGTVTNWARLIIDDVSGNEGIIEDYFANAMIPDTAYEIGTPSGLTYCHDMWANPHGDPTWATHGYLYNLVTVAKSYIWMQCHAVSVTEGVRNSASPFERLNFLTTNSLKCYSSNDCGTGVTETHAGNPTAPFTHNYPTDPIMQFMGTLDGACDGGSEEWYQPQSSGAWRSTTKRVVTTSDGTSPNEGVLVAYGPAFGDANNGMVMYEAGHSLENGSVAEDVAAHRAFFNFFMLAGIAKQIVFNAQSSPSSLMGYETGTCSVTVSAGSPPYSYAWASTVGGSWTGSNSAIATFKAPVVSNVTTGNLICTVTDACSRKNFIARPITVSTQILPIDLKSLDAKYHDGIVDIDWVTSSEIRNDYFTIERSTDGRNYEIIGQVRGSGNSSTEIAYKFSDDNPFTSMNYYRLKQTDFDGTTKSYGPVHAKVTKIQSLNVTVAGPNPFNGRLSFNYYTTRDGAVSISLINATGATVRSQIVNSNSGLNEFSFNDLDDLPAGIYYAYLTGEGDKKVLRVLKNQ